MLVVAVAVLALAGLALTIALVVEYASSSSSTGSTGSNGTGGTTTTTTTTTNAGGSGSTNPPASQTGNGGNSTTSTVPAGLPIPTGGAPGTAPAVALSKVQTVSAGGIAMYTCPAGDANVVVSGSSSAPDYTCEPSQSGPGFGAVQGYCATGAHQIGFATDTASPGIQMLFCAAPAPAPSTQVYTCPAGDTQAIYTNSAGAIVQLCSPSDRMWTLVAGSGTGTGTGSSGSGSACPSGTNAIWTGASETSPWVTLQVCAGTVPGQVTTPPASDDPTGPLYQTCGGAGPNLAGTGCADGSKPTSVASCPAGWGTASVGGGICTPGTFVYACPPGYNGATQLTGAAAQYLTPGEVVVTCTGPGQPAGDATYVTGPSHGVACPAGTTQALLVASTDGVTRSLYCAGLAVQPADPATAVSQCPQSTTYDPTVSAACSDGSAPKSLGTQPTATAACPTGTRVIYNAAADHVLVCAPAPAPSASITVSGTVVTLTPAPPPPAPPPPTPLTLNALGQTTYSYCPGGVYPGSGLPPWTTAVGGAAPCQPSDRPAQNVVNACPPGTAATSATHGWCISTEVVNAPPPIDLQFKTVCPNNETYTQPPPPPPGGCGRGVCNGPTGCPNNDHASTVQYCPPNYVINNQGSGGVICDYSEGSAGQVLSAV